MTSPLPAFIKANHVLVATIFAIGCSSASKNSSDWVSPSERQHGELEVKFLPNYSGRSLTFGLTFRDRNQNCARLRFKMKAVHGNRVIGEKAGDFAVYEVWCPPCLPAGPEPAKCPCEQVHHSFLVFDSGVETRTSVRLPGKIRFTFDQIKTQGSLVAPNDPDSRPNSKTKATCHEEFPPVEFEFDPRSNFG